MTNFHNWKVFRLEDMSENMLGYGNHYTVRHTADRPKFEIYMFEMMCFQMKQTSKFWKIGPGTLNLSLFSFQTNSVVGYFLKKKKDF